MQPVSVAAQAACMIQLPMLLAEVLAPLRHTGMLLLLLLLLHQMKPEDAPRCSSNTPLADAVANHATHRVM